jgi:DNA repair photolyase
MIEYNEVNISRILNPTAINLGEYVINPFMGCEFNCLYCYVRSNRVVSKKEKPWGSYVDVRVNAACLLEKELVKKKPQSVLLGSTTECFQPAEKEYGLTGRSLEILNRHKVYYTILTRSPLISAYIDLLNSGYCKKIYFTVNEFGGHFKKKLEPKSPAFGLRRRAINRLLERGIQVVPYFSPVLPWISKIDSVFSQYPLAGQVEFECLNFTLAHIREIITVLSQYDPGLKPKYERMARDRQYYDLVWEELKKKLSVLAKAAHKNFTIYVHDFKGYFNNKYT